MVKIGQGLMCCSICGEDLLVGGKEGAIISTVCTKCGMTSQPMLMAQMHRANIERERPEPKVIEIHHRVGRARADTR